MSVPSDTPEEPSETGLYGDLTASHPNPGPERGEGGASGAQAGAGGSGRSHVYLATACLHGQHDYCQGRTGAAGPKRPAVCKFCAAPCTCQCHRSSGTPQQADPASAQVDRWVRREQLGVLLSRMQRGVLLDAERPILRAAVETELADAEQAHADLQRMADLVTAADRTRQPQAADADRYEVRLRSELDMTRQALDLARTERPDTEQLRDERDRARRVAVELEQQLAAVAALHQPVDGIGWHEGGVTYGEMTACSACGVHEEYGAPWPCPTARAINGEAS